MLRELRQRASDAISTAREIVLSASGPAEIQAETLPCEAVDLSLYVLVARTSDLLFNLESNPLVVATADTWQARGMARIQRPGEYPDRLALARTPEAAWCQVVEIRLTRLRLRPLGAQGQGETIDLW